MPPPSLPVPSSPPSPSLPPSFLLRKKLIFWVLLCATHLVERRPRRRSADVAHRSFPGRGQMFRGARPAQQRAPGRVHFDVRGHGAVMHPQSRLPRVRRRLAQEIHAAAHRVFVQLLLFSGCVGLLGPGGRGGEGGWRGEQGQEGLWGGGNSAGNSADRSVRWGTFCTNSSLEGLDVSVFSSQDHHSTVSDTTSTLPLHYTKTIRHSIQLFTPPKEESRKQFSTELAAIANCLNDKILRGRHRQVLSLLVGPGGSCRSDSSPSRPLPLLPFHSIYTSQGRIP